MRDANDGRDVPPAPDLLPAAGDVMSTPVVVVRASDGVRTAWDTMLRTGLRHVVVLADAPSVVPNRADGVCIGVLDDRVLAMSRADGRRPVADVLPARTTCVQEQAPLRQVAQVMVRDHVDAVPVVRTDGRVVGVVTVTDVLRVLADPLAPSGPAGEPGPVILERTAPGTRTAP